MNDDELRVFLQPVINDLKSGNISQLMTIKRNLKLITELRKNNIKIDKIIALSGFSYNNKTFKSKLCYCKRMFLNNNSKNIKPDIDMKISNNENNTTESNTYRNEKPIVNNILDEDYSDWVDVLNLYKGYNIKALALVVPELIKAGWTKENYHILREHKEIMTINQLIKVVGIIESSQYRKNIFKDGELIS